MPEGEYNPSQDDQEALSTIQTFYEPQLTHKAYLERTWSYALAFTLGYQYHKWSDRDWGLVPRTMSSRKRIRETRNFIRPYVERTIASLTSFVPKFRVRPATSDIEDEQRARVGESILEHYWGLLDMQEQYQELMYWATVCGTSFLKVYWDGAGGESFAAPEVVYDDDGQPAGLGGQERLYFEGEVATEVVSPFQIHLDPLATKQSDIERILQVTKRPLSWIDRHFPEVGPHVRGDGGDDGSEYGQNRVLNLVGPGGHYAGTHEHGDTAQDWVTVKEYYETPSMEFPRGRFIMEANSVILKNGDNPTPKHKIPYIVFRDLVVPGTIWGQSNIDNLIPPQRNYNRIVSQYIEHIVTMVHSKVLFPRMAGIPESAFVAGVGEVIEYNGSTAPEHLAPPPLPASMDNEMQRLKMDIDEITSTYAVEKGIYPGKASGTAINLLQEASIKAKEPKLARNAAGLEHWGQMVLMLVQDYVSDDRTIKIHGKNNMFEVSQFSGADLMGNTDVVIELDSMRPKSRELAMSVVERMVQSGLLNPQDPADRTRAYKALDLEDDQVVISDQNQHRRVAQMEDALMLRGQPSAPAQWFEDQDIHAAQHSATMNGDEFKASPPEVQALLYEHMKSHQMLAYPQVGVTMPDSMIAQAMDPGGGETGSDSGGK
jgi:hypothetical protein